MRNVLKSYAKRLIVSSKLTRQEIAELSGVSATLISNAKNKGGSISYSTVDKIISALNPTFCDDLHRVEALKKKIENLEQLNENYKRNLTMLIDEKERVTA